MATTLRQPPQPPSGLRDTLSSPCCCALVIALVAVVVVQTLAIVRKVLPGESWTPSTGCVSDAPRQNLHVTAKGRATIVNLTPNPAHLPEVELTVNGRPARFLVDSGSTVVCMMADALDAFGLCVDAECDSVGYSAFSGVHSKRFGYVKTVTISIGETTVEVENVMVLPPRSPDDPALSIDVPFDGLLSGAFLKAVQGLIDFPAGTLRIGWDEGGDPYDRPPP
jgi:predicted aspartyl protease